MSCFQNYENQSQVIDFLKFTTVAQKVRTHTVRPYGMVAFCLLYYSRLVKVLAAVVSKAPSGRELASERETEGARAHSIRQLK